MLSSFIGKSEIRVVGESGSAVAFGLWSTICGDGGLVQLLGLVEGSVVFLRDGVESIGGPRWVVCMLLYYFGVFDKFWGWRWEVELF